MNGNELQEMLSVMTWPLVASLLLPGILVYLGIHIVRREVIFVDLALAQVATLGTCVCLYLDHAPDDPHNYYWSLGFTLAGALVFTFTRPSHKTRVPQEALIGVVYVAAAAAGILLLSKSPHGKEELQRTLVGDLLTVTPGQVGRTFALFAGVGVVHYLFRRQFIALSFHHADEEGLRSKWAVQSWDFLFYALFGLVVTSFVQLGGVLLTFSYLIVPAVCANFLSQRLGVMLLIGWLVATLSAMSGLYASYELDLPTGAAIVCALGLALLLVAALAKILHRKQAQRES